MNEVDTFAEHELWMPYHADSLNISIGEYPPMKNHAVSCFENSCKLSVIINDIIHELYSRRGPSDVDGNVIKGIRDQLDDWRMNSPKHLKYEPQDLPKYCPPPHILSQKYVSSLPIATSRHLTGQYPILHLHHPPSPTIQLGTGSSGGLSKSSRGHGEAPDTL